MRRLIILAGRVRRFGRRIGPAGASQPLGEVIQQGLRDPGLEPLESHPRTPFPDGGDAKAGHHGSSED
jgi:hypothetical protein